MQRKNVMTTKRKRKQIKTSQWLFDVISNTKKQENVDNAVTVRFRELFRHIVVEGVVLPD